MKAICIEAAELKGRIRIPPSKSISHRAIICAALAQGSSTLENIMLSEDIKATLEGIAALGAEVELMPSQEVKSQRPKERAYHTVRIRGVGYPGYSRRDIDCRESGSTLRFLIPLAALTGEPVTFSGSGRLRERPLQAYYQIFQEQRISYETSGNCLPLTVRGILKPGTYRLRGDVSSQFISGLMFALPLLNGDSVIQLTTRLQSRGYIDLTIDVLGKFGIQIENRDYEAFSIVGNQKYQTAALRVEGDFSQAAFWIAAAALNGNIHCLDLNFDSFQGDAVILQMIGQMGGKIRKTEQGLFVEAAATKGIWIDAAECPDLVPILAVVGALSQGTTRIVNAGRLRIKESDRLKAIATELNKLGAKVREQEEGLEIKGVKSLAGGAAVDSWNDHRIAMALAVAALRCERPITLTGYEAVNKSYPHFWEDYGMLGGRIK